MEGDVATRVFLKVLICIYTHISLMLTCRIPLQSPKGCRTSMSPNFDKPPSFQAWGMLEGAMAPKVRCLEIVLRHQPCERGLEMLHSCICFSIFFFILSLEWAMDAYKAVPGRCPWQPRKQSLKPRAQLPTRHE